MNTLTYTLVSDGSSDRALLPILTWLLRQHKKRCTINPQWADLSTHRPKNLVERINLSLHFYPCDLLFVHRDAERISREKREEEIRRVFKEIEGLNSKPTICVVPVRMTEAWLIIDEAALRRAAGNPQGQQELQFPSLADLEKLPDPKTLLHNLLRQASGLRGRRLKCFRPNKASLRLADLIEDFRSLRQLPAFTALENAVVEEMKTHPNRTRSG